MIDGDVGLEIAGLLQRSPVYRSCKEAPDASSGWLTAVVEEGWR